MKKFVYFIFMAFVLNPVLVAASAICNVSTPKETATVQFQLRNEGDDTFRGEGLLQLGRGLYKMVVITDVRTSGSQVNCGIIGELYFVNSGQPVFLGSQRAQKACSAAGPMPSISLNEIMNYDLDSIELAFDCSLADGFQRAE